MEQNQEATWRVSANEQKNVNQLQLQQFTN